MYLLDTCLLSESIKPKQNGGVAQWLVAQDADSCYVSAISIGELHYGTAAMLQGKRRRHFEVWVAGIEQDFAGRIVPVDEKIAACWGRLRAQDPGIPLADAQIAATALTYGFALVTRNVKDFRQPDLTVINPWKTA